MVITRTVANAAQDSAKLQCARDEGWTVLEIWVEDLRHLGRRVTLLTGSPTCSGGTTRVFLCLAIRSVEWSLQATRTRPRRRKVSTRLRTRRARLPEPTATALPGMPRGSARGGVPVRGVGLGSGHGLLEGGHRAPVVGADDVAGATAAAPGAHPIALDGGLHGTHGDRIGPVTQGRLVRRLLKWFPGRSSRCARRGRVDQRGPLAREVASRPADAGGRARGSSRRGTAATTRVTPPWTDARLARWSAPG